VTAAINNAQRFLEVKAEHGAFDRYVWQFVGGSPIRNTVATLADIVATSPESEALSKDLVRRGFKFVGPTICYAHMQAAGLVNDHLIDCFRYDQV
jgi:DNA-3-methyladenine glycosylase I